MELKQHWSYWNLGALEDTENLFLTVQKTLAFGAAERILYFEYKCPPNGSYVSLLDPTELRDGVFGMICLRGL